MSWLWKGNDEVIFETSAQRKRNEKIKNIKFFSVAAIVLAFIAGFLVLRQYDFDLSSAAPNSGEEEETTIAEEPEVVNFAYGSGTFMVYCVNDDGNDVLFLALLRADMEEGFVKIHPISTTEKILRYTDFSGEVTNNADACYKAGGCAMLKQACENYLGLTVDRYIGVTQTNFENIVVNFPELQVNVNNAVNLTKGNDSISFNMGYQKMSDENIIKFMSYNGRESEDALRADQGSVLEAMINQYFDESFVENSTNIFSRIINLMNSNISVFDLTDNMRAFKYIANKESDFECSTELDKDEFISYISEE